MFKSKKVMFALVFLLIAGIIVFIYFTSNIRGFSQINKGNRDKDYVNNSTNNSDGKNTSGNKISIPKLIISNDKDLDGITDLDDIVEGARKDAESKPTYKSEYYVGGFPPKNEGVCTDVIWRAYKNAGYNLKELVDEDINKYTSLYPGVNGKPDPNIDFRRVKNLLVFFKRNGDTLTNEIRAYDIENLKQWQPGDIVTFSNPEHIVVISDKRRIDGIPYIIHNAGPYTREADELMLWMPYITGHFRFVK